MTDLQDRIVVGTLVASVLIASYAAIGWHGVLGSAVWAAAVLSSLFVPRRRA